MLVGVVLWTIAAILILQGIAVIIRPGHIHRRVFYTIASFGGALWAIGIALFLASSTEQSLEIAFKILYTASDIMIWGFLVFVCYMTANRFRFPISVATGVMTLAVMVWIIGFNGMFAESMNVGTPNTVTIIPLPYTFYVLFFVISASIIVAVLINGYFSSKLTIEKKRLLYIAIAFAIAATVGMFFDLILPWVGDYEHIWIGPIGMAVFLVIMYMAMIRYRLFGININTARVLLMVVVAFVAAFVYAILMSRVLASDGAVLPSTIVSQMFAALIFMGITFLLIRTSFRSSQRWLERGLLDNRLLDNVFHTALISATTHDVLSGVGRIVADHIPSDGRAAAAATKTDSEPIVVSTGKAFSPKNVNKIEEIMNARNRNVLVAEEISTADADYDFLREYKVSAVVRVCSTDNERLRAPTTTYLIVCRDKAVLYSDKELSVLYAVCNIMSLTLENTLHYDKIQNFNDELEERITDATASLRSANRKLKKLYKAEDDFIAMASHQLRTPLTSIRGYISMLLEGDFGKITNEQRHVLDDVYTSSERMVFLISDFLDISRLQTGKFEVQLKPLRLDEILTPEIQQMQIAAELRRLTLEYVPPDDLPMIRGDRDKLRQVMINMIDNAIFYSHEGGRVTISLYENNDQVIFTVRDTGIGVPRAEQPKLFTKFFRASNARNIRPDGTGVGLFMVRKVIVAHGGSLIFESKEGGGSTFGFRLPIANDAAGEDDL